MLDGRIKKLYSRQTEKIFNKIMGGKMTKQAMANDSAKILLQGITK